MAARTSTCFGSEPTMSTAYTERSLYPCRDVDMDTTAIKTCRTQYERGRETRRDMMKSEQTRRNANEDTREGLVCTGCSVFVV